MTVNPFRYVNSLHTFVSDVARHIRLGDDVVAITGSYDLREIEEALADLCAYESANACCLQSSKELVRGGVYRGLTFVRMLDEPLGLFRNRCSENGLKVIMSPTGISSYELEGYGVALTGEIQSDSYRTAAIRLSSEVCGGSVYFFKSFLEVYSKSELRRKAFVNPMKAAVDVARDQIQAAANERSYALDDMSAFASFIASLANGSLESNKEGIQSTFLWAWSRGLCWRHGGIWSLDWALMSYIIDMPPIALSSLNEDAKCLIEQILTKRIGSAETSAMMPVLERYCAVAASRFVRQSCRRDGSNISMCEVKRSTQISIMREFSKQYQDRWNDYVECYIDMFNIKELRNCLCHLNPSEITDEELVAFRKALDVLNQVERMPYDESSSCVFI